MWTGHCPSDEHPADELRSNITSLIPQPPIIHPTPANNFSMPIKRDPTLRSNGQQSLLKPAVRMANTMLQTPPMSDDDEDRNVNKQTTLLQILNQAIHECDLDEDSDLCDYFDEDVDVLETAEVHVKQEDEEEEDHDDDEEEEEEEDEEDDDMEEEQIDVVKRQEQEEMNIRMKFAAESDHSYHKGKNMDVCGLVTPSDSGECLLFFFHYFCFGLRRGFGNFIGVESPVRFLMKR